MGHAQRIPAHTTAKLIPLDDISDPRLKAALELWRSLRAGRPYPAREQMTPRAMTDFLAHITLWRRSTDGSDYEYRIMGDRDVAAYGRSMIGLHVSDLDKLRPGNGSAVKAVLDYVVRKARPAVSAGWLVTSAALPVYHEMLFLPLGPDDRTIDHILGVAAHTNV